MNAAIGHFKKTGPNLPAFPHAEGVRTFMTVAEAAGRLGCTRRFLELRIADGELKIVRLSRRLVRIRVSDFDAWIESLSTKGAA